MHVVDGVLLPLFESVVEIAENFDAFSILVDAVHAAKLDGTLSGRGAFTVFAPPNSAFFNLVDALGMTVGDILRMPNLDEILTYHVLAGEITTDELKDESGHSIATVNGQSVEISSGLAGLAILDAHV